MESCRDIWRHGFCYRDESALRQAFGEPFDIVAVARYRELEDGDSVFVMARLPSPA